jgi:hypothetical protein
MVSIRICLLVRALRGGGGGGTLLLHLGGCKVVLVSDFGWNIPTTQMVLMISRLSFCSPGR